MVDAELGEYVARRLAAITGPILEAGNARLDASLDIMRDVLAQCGEIKAKLLLIEEHYQACPEIRAQREGTQ